MVEWIVPVNWKSVVGMKTDTVGFEAAGTATEDDQTLLECLKQSGASSSAAGEGQKGSTGVDIKTEPPCTTALLAKRVEDFVRNKEAVLRKFQDIEIKAKSLETRANQKSVSKESNKFAEPFKVDLKTHISKVARALKILLRFVTETCEDKEIPEFLDTLDQIAKKHDLLTNWGQRFGFVAEEKPPKKRKTRKGNDDE